MPSDDHSPTSAASPMPAESLERSSLEDDLVEGRRVVILAAYNTPIEAQIARSRLEIEGIAADLMDENTVSIGTHLALAVGGVKLRVFEDELEDARDILDNLGEFELPGDDEDEDEDDGLMQRVDEASPDALVARAFTAGVIGVLFFPPLNLYSLWLVWRALLHPDRLEGMTRSKAKVAIVADVVGLAWFAYVLGIIL